MAVEAKKGPALTESVEITVKDKDSGREVSATVQIPTIASLKADDVSAIVKNYFINMAKQTLRIKSFGAPKDFSALMLSQIRSRLSSLSVHFGDANYTETAKLEFDRFAGMEPYVSKLTHDERAEVLQTLNSVAPAKRGRAAKK